MNPRQQIWLVTLGMSIVFLAWQYYPRDRATVVASRDPVSTLFDTQAVPSALPAERPRSPQSQAGIPTLVSAVRRSKARPERSVRLGLDRPAREEEVFVSGRGSYRWLATIFALPDDQAGSLDVVEARSGYVFVKVPNGEAPPGAYPVAYQPKNGTLYVVTGRLTVHFTSVADAAAMSQDYSMELLRLMTRLNTATYQSSRPTVQKLTELLEALRKDARVVKASLEMIGEGRTAQ